MNDIPSLNLNLGKVRMDTSAISQAFKARADAENAAREAEWEWLEQVVEEQRRVAEEQEKQAKSNHHAHIVAGATLFVTTLGLILSILSFVGLGHTSDDVGNVDYGDDQGNTAYGDVDYSESPER